MTTDLIQRPSWSECLVHPMRTFHTLRHLRPRQITYRAWRSVRPAPGARLTADAAPVLVGRRPAPSVPSVSAAFDGDSFCFLNRRIRWEGARRWTPAGADDLWIFNLHYFKFLASTSAVRARDVILDWIDVNRDRRSAAWQPYPLSLRVREWIEWLHTNPQAPEPLRQAMIGSIAAQVDWLGRRLEFDLMGNHLLENAITLCWAGLSFAGTEAERWRREGEALLEREMCAQLLADGSHEERSPMYQAQLAEGLLRLAEVAAQTPTPSAARLAARARAAGAGLLAALDPLVHPDGDYALMNDTALGVAPTLGALRERFDVGAGGRQPWMQSAGGFAGCRPDAGGYLVFDAGPIGPKHQPGHGHAGALSFELSAGGRRIVTDTGVLTYACGAARRHDRSTAAHNTVEIDGRDQSEVWGAFRCGRRSSIVTAAAGECRDGATLIGEYRGPGRGHRSVSHAREVFVNRRVLAFTDTVRASGDHHATVRLHLAPGLEVTGRGRVCHITDERRRPVAAVAADGFEWTASSSPYHPEFGREVERPLLSARLPFRDALVAKWWLMLN